MHASEFSAAKVPSARRAKRDTTKTVAVWGIPDEALAHEGAVLERFRHDVAAQLIRSADAWRDR